jgi:membrane peptidoglycan carboxypeptidase
MMLSQGRVNIFVRVFQKMKEWIVAVKLERNFTKEEIITLYLNRAPWGNVYGIRKCRTNLFSKRTKGFKNRRSCSADWDAEGIYLQSDQLSKSID